MREKGENGTGGSSTVTLPPSLLRDPDLNIPSVSHSGGGCMCCGCSWATGAHMTELSTYGTGVHVASMLGVSRGGHSTEGANVFGALGANMVGGSTLKTSHHSGCWRGGVGDINGVSACTSSHNHLQSSGRSNASRAHCRSSSPVNSRPTSLSWSSVPSVAFPRGKGVWSVRGKWVRVTGQLRRRVDGSVSGGYGVGW